MPMPRYGTFVWDADGDMGDALIVGPFKTVKRAEQEADRLRSYGESQDEAIECVVVRVVTADIEGNRVLDWVTGRMA